MLLKKGVMTKMIVINTDYKDSKKLTFEIKRNAFFKNNQYFSFETGK